METDINFDKTIFADLKFREDGALLFHYPPKFSWEYDSEFHQTALEWKDYHFYLHVPFCRNICNYCTFERRKVTSGSIDKFIRLLDIEMDNIMKLDNFNEANIKSVYFGGGTASLLPNYAIDKILSRLRKNFGLKDGNTEVTLECEPGTKKKDDLREIKSFGVNRISIGVQSFDDILLQILNRSHSKSHSLRMVKDVREAGFKNIHVDLMYGLPGQTITQWINTLNHTIDLGIHHVSAYQLIVFPHEQLDYSLKKNHIPKLPSRGTINEMRICAKMTLSQAGFESYSTADYSLPSFECEYVQSSWNGSSYLGMGPGSYSRNNESLWEDEVIHPIYEKKVKTGYRPVGKSIIMTPFELFKRDITMGLCLLQVNISDIEQRTGIEFWPVFGDLVEEYSAYNLMDYKDGILSLTDLGVRFATHIMKSFADH